MKEMRYMKADAESNVKTAQYLLNRISKFYFNQSKMGVANLKMSEGDAYTLVIQ